MPDQLDWDNAYGYGSHGWYQVLGPGQYLPVQTQAYVQQQLAQLQNARQYIKPIAPPVPDEEGLMLNDFKIGCDPEFVLLDGQGKTVEASRYFHQIGEIGYDHGGRVAEYRPTAFKGVYPIIKKIKALVDKTIVVAPQRLRAGAMCNQDCLGGHIHFGFNCFEQKPPSGYGAAQGYGVFNERGKETTKALDTLTKALEHLDILPKNESTKRRESAQGTTYKYGHYGDVRDCHGHMEYRTMASWLYDPKVTFLCLTAAKLAAVDPQGTLEALKGCDNFAKLRAWLEQYASKDFNASRASEKILDKGLRALQVDPEVDFRERWEELGI